jgi:thioredoxin reductase (NADPH)
MSTSTPLSPNNLRESDCERFGLQKLDAEEISALSRFGRNRTHADGEHLFCTGDRDLSVYIVMRGEVQVYFMRGGAEREVVVLGDGHVIGDISMLTRMAAVVSVRARGELEVIEIPAKEFRCMTVLTCMMR